MSLPVKTENTQLSSASRLRCLQSRCQRSSRRCHCRPSQYTAYFASGKAKSARDNKRPCRSSIGY